MMGLIPNDAMYLFNKGENYYSYYILGAHKAEVNGVRGYNFAVWAPNAKSVSVVCNLCHWDRNVYKMNFHSDFGIWELFIEGVQEGEVYKYSVEGKDGKIILKADPYGFSSEVRPANSSVTADISYNWHDSKWLEKRTKVSPYDRPMNIYEVHFASWKQHEDGTFLTYREMAEELVPYVKEMGYTHIELMPICEFPFDGSWGYQVTGYYAANSRFGSPCDLKYFIDMCHKADIGVIMDWVPAHFPRDEHALGKFDGTALFEHPDTRLGEHKEWGTYVFNWQRTEVLSFLISNAVFWVDEYHFDGLRVDAVSSMLYRDYNRRDGEWVANKYGGKENLEAIDFLQKLNVAMFERFPNILMIAEESTAWPGVTKPAYENGLGFNYKWNMGWMNDILTYMSMDPFFRGNNHDKLTFSMMYAYAENYILAFSHDEVVHGKGSLVNKMSGTYEQKFASLRLLYSFMYSHPGKKLVFMGGEFGQFIEWRYYEGLEWHLLGIDMHKKMHNFTKALNHFYKSHKALYENNSDWDGFKWITAEDRNASVIAFIRQSRSHREKIIVAANFAAKGYDCFSIGVPSSGTYEIVFDSNDWDFGGSGENKKVYKAYRKQYGDFKYCIDLELPELTAYYIKKTTRKK